MAGSEHKIYLDQYYNLHYPPGTKHTDGAPEEVLEIAHPHWTQFPPTHPAVQHIFGILFFMLWLISFTGNGLVMYIFLKVKALRTPSNMLVVSLALSDFIMMNTQGPPLFINVFLSRYWAYGEPMCNLYAFLGGVFGLASLWLIILIGYDRYNVIVKGLSGKKITPGIAFIMIAFAFLYSTAVCIPPYLKVWGKYTLEGLLLTCSFDYVTDTMNNRIFTAWFFTFCYVIPLLFVAFFYSQIVSAVVSHERALKAQAKKMNVDSLRSNADTSGDSAEVRIAKVAITNVTVWVVAWSPYAFIAVIGQFGGASMLTPLVTQLPSFAAKTASVFNPIIYAVSHPKYREALTKHVPCLGIREESKADQSEDKTVAATA